MATRCKYVVVDWCETTTEDMRQLLEQAYQNGWDDAMKSMAVNEKQYAVDPKYLTINTNDSITYSNTPSDSTFTKIAYNTNKTGTYHG